MSLINDALKKAQRQRAEEQVTLPPMGGRSSSGRQTGAQTMILIGAGAAVLIAVSVVITVHLLGDRTPPTLTVSAAPTPRQVSTSSTVPALPSPAAVVKPSAIVAAPVPTIALAPPPTTISSPHETVSSEPALATESPSPIILTDSLKSDEDIQAMVDKFKVSGVRSGGSKVLMNDHIVRLNEVVDRGTGLRLVKIEDDMLIFKDAKGTLYTKNF